jgi:hypothetical protein
LSGDLTGRPKVGKGFTEAALSEQKAATSVQELPRHMRPGVIDRQRLDGPLGGVAILIEEAGADVAGQLGDEGAPPTRPVCGTTNRSRATSLCLTRPNWHQEGRLQAFWPARSGA